MADIRVLLHDLADEVGTVTAPPDLAQRGRRRLRTRRALAVGTAALAAGSVGLATVLVPHSTASKPVVPSDEGTAAELAKGHWSIGDRPAPDRTYGAHLTWTGTEVIALGGRTDASVVRQNYAWSPATRQWHPIADAPDSIGSGNGGSTWTGSELFVLPGYRPDVAATSSRALLYDPASDVWRQSSELRHSGPAYADSVTWTGSRVFVAGASDGRLFGQLYDPTADVWTESTPLTPAHHEVDRALAFATPKGLLLWSFWTHTVATGNPGETSNFFGIDVFLDRGNGWEDITQQWPARLYSETPFMVGDQLELGSGGNYCGRCSGPWVPGQPASLIDLDRLVAVTLPKSHVDTGRPSRTWTGQAEIAVNSESFQGGSDPLYPGEAEVRDPETGWHSLPKAPTYLSGQAIWTGHELVTETYDGRIVTFGSDAPPALPGCPERQETQKAEYDSTARIDVSGVTDARVCTYTVADRTGLVYDHAVEHAVSADQLAQLLSALQGARPFDSALADCAAYGPTAQTILLLDDGRVRSLTRGGRGCGPLTDQGHFFGGGRALHDALEAIIG